MAMNQPFTTASPQLVSYNWADINTSVGYKTYYLIQSETSSGLDYHLTSQTDYSANPTITINAATFDQDFDLTAFQTPQDIEGTALFSLPIVSASAATPDVIIELYKWDGSTETIIGSNVHLDAACDTPEMRYFNYTIPYTHFAEGETLRLRLQVAQPSAVNATFGIDPAARTDATLTITTQSKIHIPFKTNA